MSQDVLRSGRSLRLPRRAQKSGVRKNSLSSVRRRRRWLEQLEARQMLAADVELSQPVQDQLVYTLRSLDSAADAIAGNPLLERALPATGQSLNDLLDVAGTNGDWGDLLRFEQVVVDYFESFDPASPLYDPATSGNQPTAGGLRDVLANSLQLDSAGAFVGRDANPPLIVNADLDPTTNVL